MADQNLPNYLDITLLGKEYRIACPPEEREALQAAVSYVDEKMHEISDRTKSNIAERIAVMAALNIAHEFLQLQAGVKPARASASSVDAELIRRKMDEFEGIIEKAVADQEKLF